MRTFPRFNRREHERFRLNPMYTDVVVDANGGSTPGLCGHAYDISETGVRIELDEPLQIGQAVNVQLDLPGAEASIRSQADVQWVNDEHDDPGPRRMALHFTGFQSPRDQQRLQMYLGNGLQHLAA